MKVVLLYQQTVSVHPHICVCVKGCRENLRNVWADACVKIILLLSIPSNEKNGKIVQVQLIADFCKAIYWKKSMRLKPHGNEQLIDYNIFDEFY